MTGPRAPLDADPLEPTDVDQAYAEGFADAWNATHTTGGRWSNGIWLGCLLLIAAIVVGAILAGGLMTLLAAPRSGQTTERFDMSPPSSAALSGAPSVAGRPSLSAARLAAAAGDAPSPAAELGTAIAGGILAYADPSFGPRYLAIPQGPGHRVRICAGSGTVSRCLERVSTDAGPALFRQREGRIGDVSFADFAWLCSCDPRIRGTMPGSIELLGARATPPATDVGR